MTMIKVPVSKAGVVHEAEVDTTKIPDEVFQYFCILGIKSGLGRGMTKLTKSTPNAAKLVAEQVEKNLADIYAGKVRMTGGIKQKGVSKSAEMTEAIRQAKLVVKDTIRAQGEKVSHYADAEITKFARELVNEDPSYLESAKKVLAERAQAKPKITIDVKKMAKSASKVAAAESKKKERKPSAAGQASAKQAGKTKVAPAKGQPARPHA